MLLISLLESEESKAVVRLLTQQARHAHFVSAFGQFFEYVAATQVLSEIMVCIIGLSGV